MQLVIKIQIKDVTNKTVSNESPPGENNDSYVMQENRSTTAERTDDHTGSDVHDEDNQSYTSDS